MPTRSVSNDAEVVAVLTFDGVGDTGAFAGDTRSITGFEVINNKTVPVFVRVEEEADKQRVFELTVQPGETVSAPNIPAGQRPRQVWVVERLARWNGLNVYWRIPA